MYVAIYMPVNRPWEDGCIYLDKSGNHHVWNADLYESEKEKERGKVAELFIVTKEFNEVKIVGKPSAAALKWVKAGMKFKHFNVVDTGEKVYHGNPLVLIEEVSAIPFISTVKIRCEVCGHLEE